MLLKTFDQIDTLPGGFDVVDFTKLEKLFTLKGTEGRGVEEDLGCRGRRGHHGRMIDKDEDERDCEKKLNKTSLTPKSRDCGCPFTTRVSRVCDRNDSEHTRIPRVWRRSGKSAENRIKITGRRGGVETVQWAEGSAGE